MSKTANKYTNISSFYPENSSKIDESPADYDRQGEFMKQTPPTYENSSRYYQGSYRDYTESKNYDNNNIDKSLTTRAKTPTTKPLYVYSNPENTNKELYTSYRNYPDKNNQLDTNPNEVYPKDNFDYLSKYPNNATKNIQSRDNYSKYTSPVENNFNYNNVERSNEIRGNSNNSNTDKLNQNSMTTRTANEYKFDERQKFHSEKRIYKDENTTPKIKNISRELDLKNDKFTFDYDERQKEIMNLKLKYSNKNVNNQVNQNSKSVERIRRGEPRGVDEPRKMSPKPVESKSNMVIQRQRKFHEDYIENDGCPRHWNINKPSFPVDRKFETDTSYSMKIGKKI